MVIPIEFDCLKSIENSKIVGEVIKLDKPQIVYKKWEGYLEVQAVIREKLLFSKRPTPLTNIKRSKLE